MKYHVSEIKSKDMHFGIGSRLLEMYRQFVEICIQYLWLEVVKRHVDKMNCGPLL